MSKLFSYFVGFVLIGLGVVYFMYGPSFLMGGPKKADIIEVTMQTLIDTAPDSAMQALAKDAQITPKGICSSQGDGKFACIVDAVVGGEDKSFVSELVKGNDGTWRMAE